MINKIYEIILILILVFAGSSLVAQNQQKTLKIYLNCDFCDNSYIKQNLNYVEFVRDRNFADVQLMFRSQETGGGGKQYEIQFMGQQWLSILRCHHILLLPVILLR